MTVSPSPFDPAAVAPETAAFNDALEKALALVPVVNTVPPELTRKARAEGRGLFPPAGPLEGSEWREIPGAPGGPARRVRLSPAPGAARGTYLHIHGGGWTLGCPDQSDGYNQRIARETGLDVVSAEYRLSPENRWPGCAEDCEAAARWVLETRPGPVLIGGESAGGHLSMVTFLRLAAAGLADRIAGLVLNYGVFDMRMTPSARNWGQRYLILSTPVIDWFAQNLLGAADRADPGVSPLLAPLPARLPPALFQCGTADPLIDDTLFMGQRWQAAGGRAEVAIYPGGVHAFDCFDLGIARQSRAREAAFLRDCLG
ncbi:alpha/beta hydrolase [Limibaculum sp. M0105]|uniref:Alpha/beta hydrolase n=1 Tax=Thermohalobaculum xanthum TaxID=2753746 RepID=A0A8J7M9V4_9RHOB|nr:alpha/beta hydrolase [Thermohalobaculum xanthum]MBK0401031.1 alpha/beta hydrolase [Thermohalobaculum xanthum]